MKWYLKVFRQYAVFSGRARRKEYWYFILFHFIACFVVALIDEVAHSVFLYTLYLLFALIPSLAVAVRRMHDVGKSGWFCLVPIYNLVLACTNGETGENQYGPDPKGEAYSFDFEQEQSAKL